VIKIVTTLLFLVLFSGCFSEETSSQKSTNSSKSSTLETAPTTHSSFILETIDNQQLHMEETAKGLNIKGFENRVVLIIFFGHRCPPCLAEIPILNALTDKGHTDLEIIGIEVQGHNKQQLKAFAKRKGIKYHLVAGKDYQQFSNYIMQKTAWHGSIPFLVGFDKQGEVRVVHTGGLNKRQFDNVYKNLSTPAKP